MTKTPQAVNQQQNQLPKFTETIKIEVDIQSIHEKLMDTFPDDYKHKEILSHAIIGSAVENDSLVYVYNALNGYTNDVDFKVGDLIVCTEEERRDRYDANEPVVQSPHDGDYKPNWKYRDVEIKECRVVEINWYKRNKLKVEFQSYDRYSGELVDTQTWVNHKKCTKWTNVEVVASAR